MITKKSALAYVGHHCKIEWTNGTMSGTVTDINDYGWLEITTDNGPRIVHLKNVTKLEKTVPPKNLPLENWPIEPDEADDGWDNGWFGKVFPATDGGDG